MESIFEEYFSDDPLLRGQRQVGKFTLTVVTAILVSSCSFPIPTYVRGPKVKGGQTVEMDIALCRLQAEKMAGTDKGLYSGPKRRAEILDACMKAKGYVVERRN